jgi:hypothetical protein
MYNITAVAYEDSYVLKGGYSSLKGTKYATEIRKGMKLAKYVMIKNNL